MTRQVALSEPAYAALRRAKQGKESFSDVVMRLLAEHKDPRAFARRRHAFIMSMEAHLAEAEVGREGDDPHAGA